MKLTNDTVLAPDLGTDDLAWRIDDRFGSAAAVRIRTPQGEDTGCSMVYGLDPKTNVWMPVRPVTDRYTPIGTETIVNTAAERFGIDLDDPSTSVKLEHDRANTVQRVSIVFGDEYTLNRRRPYDAGTDWTAHGTDVRADKTRPRLEISNSYCALRAASTMLGLFRLICSNGLVIMDEGLRVRSMHTVHEVEKHIERLARMDLSCLNDRAKQMRDVKLTDEQIAKISATLPKKRHDEMVANMALDNNTAWSALNYLTFLRDREYTVSRQNQLDKALTMVSRLAA